MAPPLVVVTKRMPHHRGHAGYNQLIEHVRPDETIMAPAGPAWRTAGAVSRRLWRPVTGTRWYGAPSLVAELLTLRQLRGRPPCTVHVFYGEDLLFLLPRIKRRHRVVATFHQPPERFEHLVERASIWSRLDAVIVLDDKNLAAWRKRISSDRVHRSTLGIDLEYWHPGEAEQPRVLTVGSHLRDFDLLETVVDRMTDVTFDLVIPTREARRFEGQRHVHCHHDVDDDVLANMYRSASVLFLPLKGGSASNTMLQGLASGLPIVTSAYAGVDTYLDDTVARLAPVSDARAHEDALRNVLGDDARRASMRVAAREHAATYSWPAVAAQHRDIYAKLHADKDRQ